MKQHGFQQHGFQQHGLKQHGFRQDDLKHARIRFGHVETTFIRENVFRNLKFAVLAVTSIVFLGLGSISCAPLKESRNPNESSGNRPPPSDPKSLSGVCETQGSINLAQPGALQSIPSRSNGEFCAIVLSVPQVIIDWLVSGSKTWEYRKSHPADPVSHIVFYNTTTRELFGIAEVSHTLGGPPVDIVNKTWTESGTTADVLLGYYGDRPVGFATKILSMTPFQKKIPLAEARQLDASFSPPPGYLFLDRFPSLNSAIRQRISLPSAP